MPKSQTVQMLKLPVKFAGKYLYLEKSEGFIRNGPSGVGAPPKVFADRLPKGQRRKFRKALHAAGCVDLVLETLN